MGHESLEDRSVDKTTTHGGVATPIRIAVFDALGHRVGEAAQVAAVDVDLAVIDQDSVPLSISDRDVTQLDLDGISNLDPAATTVNRDAFDSDPGRLGNEENGFVSRRSEQHAGPANQMYWSVDDDRALIDSGSELDGVS